jgi:hypothetical protein
MRFARPAFAIDQRRFGRRAFFLFDAPPQPLSMSDDLRLFAATFLGGFLFMGILLA